MGVTVCDAVAQKPGTSLLRDLSKNGIRARLPLPVKCGFTWDTRQCARSL